MTGHNGVDTTTIARRSFLYGAAISASGVVLGACSDQGGGRDSGDGGRDSGASGRVGSDAEQPPVPERFGEAPDLAEQVEAGELPPVEERLPRVPYVIPHRWTRPGRYGGVLQMISPGTSHPSNREFMYGHSPLRWLNDCLDLGQGLAESWESNDDTSEWTFHFREGLKWSDGEPWTTADILFWWEDLVLNEEHSATPPDELRSGTGTPAEVTAPDDLTLVVRFDAPSPLTADRVAMWVNGGIGSNGPIWMLPRHYLEQFHPTYNPDVPADWASADGEFEQRSDFARNPECPTMTGWRLQSFSEGSTLVWERNPYYWCIDRDGNQLPYLDGIVMSVVEDPEIGKLQIQNGDVDYGHGPFISLELTDVSALRQSEERSRIRVLLWDSGSGGGSTTMLNWDYRDEKFRELFRDQRFRRALSHAFDRAEVQKSVYFDTGELTTGTLSPKAIEYQVEPEGPKIYQEWRDSYVEYDPALAERLLDEIGVVDENGDGVREFPDGNELSIRIDYPADSPPSHLQMNEHLADDWNAIGIQTQLNPVSPEAYDLEWSTGELMTNTTWELGDGPNHLVFPNFLIPIDPGRWAPLHGQHYALMGSAPESDEADVEPYDRSPPRTEPEPESPIARLWALYDESKMEPDEMKRHELVWEMIKVHIEDGPFMHGSVADYQRVIVAHRDLRNVPEGENLAQGGFANPWIHPTPAVYDPEAYYWENPDDHT